MSGGIYEGPSGELLHGDGKVLMSNRDWANLLAARGELTVERLIAHRWSATQVWPNDDAKVYCRCGALLTGTTEAEAHRAWAAHVLAGGETPLNWLGHPPMAGPPAP
jgi:hypothetical protein